MPPAVLVRRIDHNRPADRAIVVELLREHLAGMNVADDPEARYRWLYLDNPHGAAVTYLATDASTAVPAGMTSLFPRRVLVAGRVRVGSIGGDGFVRPEFRRRGIARQLHQAAREGMRAEGDGSHGSHGSVGFMYGPPEPHNLKALLGAGSAVIGSVQRHLRLLSARSLSAGKVERGPLAGAVRRILRPPRARFRLEALDGSSDHRVDRVFTQASDSAAVLPVLDADFCAWRFGRSPSGRQRPFLVLDGKDPVAVAAVERNQGRAGLITLACAPAFRTAALRTLLDACRDADTIEIQIHVPASDLRRALLLLGFFPRERKPFQIQIAADHPDRTLLVREEGWSYSWGDGDVDRVL
jgi:GNAT superfamily N-acetyltransferase